MAICWKTSTECERDRYNKLLAEFREDYPVMSFNYMDWKRTPISTKVKECVKSKADIEVLRVLKNGKNADYLDGGRKGNQRVDGRGQDAYGQILKEYEKIYEQKYCTTVIDLNTSKKDRDTFLKETSKIGDRVEDNTDINRTIILGVGGFVLLAGIFIIFKNRS